MPKCKNCNNDFIVYPEDKTFYAKFEVPEPTWCPQCREMRRWTYRNTKTLYPRKCDLCKKDVISVYSTGTEYKVYCPDCWYGDKWEARDWACDFDFSRPFFEQFNELMLKVPRISNYNHNSINCDYCNAIVDSKNCYLLFSARAEDCYYGYKIIDCKDCVDNLGITNCELCHQCVDCLRCFNVVFSHYAYDCRDAAWLFNCFNCHDCCLCTNLKNKEYHFLNQPLSEEDYKKKISEWQQGGYEVKQKYLEEYKKLKLQTIHRFAEHHNCTDCSGDNLHNCKHCFCCFDLVNSTGSRYFADAMINTTDCMDSIVGSIDNEMLYETLSTLTSYRLHFTTYCWVCNFLYYCDHLLAGGSYCFGCSGLKKAKHSILNKQYSEDEYNKLKNKIIEHMRKTGEFGEFFPIERSSFAYNETAAMDHFPLTKEEVLKKGWRWKDDLPGVYGQETMKAEDLPDSIQEVEEDILKEVIACVDCKKNYKIIKPELNFYKKQKLPLPRQCFDCRYDHRFKQRNPHQLWRRQCMCEQEGHRHQGRCPNKFQTSYAPEREEKVYCQDCYNKEVY